MKAELLTENLFSMKDFVEQFENGDIYNLLTAPTYAIKGTIKDLHKLDEKKHLKINDLSIFQIIKPNDATHVEFQNRDFPFCIDQVDGCVSYVISNKEVINTTEDPNDDTNVTIFIYNEDVNIDSLISIYPSDDYEDDGYINLEFTLTNRFITGKPNSIIDYPFEIDGFTMHACPCETSIDTNITFDIDNVPDYDRYDFDFIIVATESTGITPILYGVITKKFAGEEEKYIRVMDYRMI